MINQKNAVFFVALAFAAALPAGGAQAQNLAQNCDRNGCWRSDSDDDWYAHHSTPQERAETQDLNRNAAMAEPPPPPPPDNSAAMADYQRQMDQYRQEQQRYLAERRAFETEAQNYAQLRDRNQAEQDAYLRHRWGRRYEWAPGRYYDDRY